jgi:hypothetical protein
MDINSNAVSINFINENNVYDGEYVNIKFETPIKPLFKLYKFNNDRKFIVTIGKIIIHINSHNLSRCAFIGDLEVLQNPDEINYDEKFHNFGKCNNIDITMYDNGQGMIKFMLDDNIIENIQLHPEGLDDDSINFVTIFQNYYLIWSYNGVVNTETNLPTNNYKQDNCQTSSFEMDIQKYNDDNI